MSNQSMSDEKNFQQKYHHAEMNYRAACEVINDVDTLASRNGDYCEVCSKIYDVASKFLCTCELIAPINNSDDGVRRVVRSLCGTCDYVFDGDETVCTFRVPEVETAEYFRRVAQVVAAPDADYEIMAAHEVMDAAGIANADDGRLMTLSERVELLAGAYKNYANEVTA